MSYPFSRRASSASTERQPRITFSAFPISLSRKVFPMREHRSNVRFNGAVTGALHARRASAKDIDRSVRIRVGSVSAIDAVKDRLALAALSVHGPAFRTGLRGIGGIDIFDTPAARLKFVFQHGREGGPALRQDRTVEAALAGAAGGHVGHLELLQRHHAEAPGDIRRSLVQPVTARGRSVGVMLGDDCLLAGSPRRSFLSARQNALSALPFIDRRGDVIGHLIMLASRKTEGVNNATVDADRRQIGFALRRIILNQTGCIPSTPGQLNSYVPNFAVECAREAKLKRGAFWDTEQCPFSVDDHYVAISAGSAKGIVFAAAPHRRMSRPTGEKTSVGQIEVAQSVLANHSRHVCYPGYFSAKLGQLVALPSKTERPASRVSIVSAPISPLFERQIIDEPNRADVLPQNIFLLDRRIKPVFASAYLHREIILCSRLIGNISPAISDRKGTPA